MERMKIYVYLAVAIALVVLLAALAQSYMALQSANSELDHYQKQQKELARAITIQYLPDMQTARARWISLHQDDYRDLQNNGIIIEANYVGTPYFTAVLDPSDPNYVSFGQPGQVEPGEAIIGLGQYFQDNMTEATGWTAYYKINETGRSVSGFTSVLAQSIAYDYYDKTLAGSVYNNLGVSPDTVQGYSPLTLDSSYLPDKGMWLDVSEYKYQLRNTNLPAYLTVKTYINASTETVESVDVSQPYYTTVSTIIH